MLMKCSPADMAAVPNVMYRRGLRFEKEINPLLVHLTQCLNLRANGWLRKINF